MKDHVDRLGGIEILIAEPLPKIKKYYQTNRSLTVRHDDSVKKSKLIRFLRWCSGHIFLVGLFLIRAVRSVENKTK